MDSGGRLGMPARCTEHVPQRDPLLAVVAELGDVFADPVLQVQDALLVELVDHHGGDRLGGRVDAEGGLEGRQHLGRVGVVVGRVARGVPQRAVQHHPSASPDADLKGGVEAGPVEILRAPPHRVDRGAADARALQGLLLADRGHLRQVPGDGAAGQQGDLHPGDEV